MKKYIAEKILPGTKLEGCMVVRPNTRYGTVFVKDAKGKIYQASYSSYYDLDILRASSSDRAAYAKLVGLSVKQLNDEKKANEEKLRKQYKASALMQLRRSAELYGYKLVKTK